ncbi:unnamed protein product, partial [Meganyctiphanes norvegica]
APRRRFLFKMWNFVYVCFPLLLLTTQVVHVENDLPDLTIDTCPQPEDIAPCLCRLDLEPETLLPNIECNGIEEDDLLGRVFQAYFPTKDFHMLHVHNSHGVQHLKNGVFGDVTFEVIFFDTTRLESVERDVFNKSVSTMKELIFRFNNIRDDFPFDILKDYVALEKFEVNSCENYHNFCITNFPIIDAPQLKYLDISEQPIYNLPDDPFQGVPNIIEIQIGYNGFTDIPKGIFENLHSLEKVYLILNRLTELQEGLFTMNSENLKEIVLSTNKIRNIHKNAFVGLNISSQKVTIDLWGNNIQTLNRTVYEDLLSLGTYMDLRANPLECGCDADWIVFHPEYQEFVSNAECKHGRLIDQDVGWYEANC